MFGWLKRKSKVEPPIEYDYDLVPIKIDGRNTLVGVTAADGAVVGILGKDERADTYFSTACDGSFVEAYDDWDVAQHLIQRYVDAF